MMVMMVFRTQGLWPLRRPRFRLRDLPRAAATEELPAAAGGGVEAAR
jgi:hypothetical protein